MTLEALSIVIYTLLIFAAVMVQAVYSARTAGPAFGFSNREGAPPGMGAAGLRIDKTLANLKEGAIMYLPLALLAVSLDVSNAWTWSAALLTIVSRLIYVPVFYLGIPIVRTLVWAPGFVAIPTLAVGILIGAA
ncbi:MAPEG family protein [Marivita sp.]|uniref:MAPEG family protein n=1 Tax=Marivita sp. TaxID=2003365 RepID=UPI0025C3D538|nr:MAPEG family protein [Marivita sp.]